MTAAALALAPLVRAGLIETTGIIVDAASGVSGAGRPPKPTTTFCTVDEDFTAYGLLTHRHTPEMEQAIGAQLLFTPHLAPMNRGILATCYARPADGVAHHRRRCATCCAPPTPASPSSSCATAPLVDEGDAGLEHRARDGASSTRAPAGSSPCGALDNLVKGAAGQAVQCANLLLGLPETTGLATAGLYP